MLILGNLFDLFPDIEIQMQYTSETVSETISNTTVCAIITSGILGKNVTVIMETHSITGMLLSGI